MPNKTNISFRPVRGSDEAIQNMTTVDGYFYMATDSRKSYLGMANGEKILMGHDIGVFYGLKEIPEDNSGNPLNPEVYFNIVEIEGDRLPLINDLILNTDGCFYRVDLVMDNNNVRTQRLTLQGSGTGSGDSTGSGGGSSFNISFTNTSKNFVFSSQAETMEIGIVSYYNGTDDNYLSTVTFTFADEEEPFYTVNKTLAFNQIHTIDLISCKDLFTTVNKTVKITIYDKYGVDRFDDIKVRLVTIALNPVENDLFYSVDPIYNYVCELIGATAGVESKKIIYTFYNENNLNQVIYTTEVDVALNSSGKISKDLHLEKLTHGVYTMKVQAQATITGTANIIYSNILTHKMGYYKDMNSGPLLLIQVPDKIEQYTNTPVNYLFIDEESNKERTLEIKLDNVEQNKLTILSNVAGVYNLYFENKGTYNAQFTILETGNAKTVSLIVIAYSGNLPTIDVNRDDLLIYLNPRGKTNNDVNRNEWVDSKNSSYKATLQNVNYSDAMGWLTEDDGTAYLQLSSGASMTLNDFRLFATDLTTKAGLTVELDFEISGILDFDESLISCVSSVGGKPSAGFEIVGNVAKFYSSREDSDGNKVLLSGQTITENKRIRLSYVLEDRTTAFPMCYTYLNGKLSGANTYSLTADFFTDTESAPALLKINARAAQIKIYGMRFYRQALTDREILNNYTASFASITDRQATYDSNNVFDNNNLISYTLVSAEEYNLQIPYMKLTGGYKTASKDDKWTLASADNMNAGLPTGKKDYRLVDVQTIYPKNDYFKDYENFEFINKFENDVPMSQAYGQRPKNGGATMYAQGTSSMEYPVKNLRIRFKKENDFYRVRPDIEKVEIICMKADFMESSGSHNTGAANFIDKLYSDAGMKTPGQAKFSTTENQIVTCIKGHPCLIFYSESGDPGTYKFVGKYNLNLDKATPEPFGFKHEVDAEGNGFGYLDIGEEYYAIDYDDDGDKFIGQLDPSAGGDYADSKEGETLTKVTEKNTVNSIHCFEFLDNNVAVCNFITDVSMTNSEGNIPQNYEDTWYGSFYNTEEKKNMPGWTFGFESRYPEDRVGYHDADMLYSLASWINDLYNIRYGLEGKEKNEALALERFKNEYETHLDKNFLLTYYLVTEALLMVDSRVKNMMIATWGKETRTYYDVVAGEEKTSHNYIFYPIFYDMDTMLGLDNKGYARFNYYDEDTDPAIYNGQEVLWNFVRDALKNELDQQYNRLESAGLSAVEILPFFNKNQANMANEAFYNGDAQYKYIRPFREGYINDSDGSWVDKGQAQYLYAVQGDRSLMREEFLTNRMQLLRGKHESDTFKNADRITYRLYYPKSDDSSDDPLLEASAAVVPPNGDFNLTSVKTGYAGIHIGANGQHKIERFNGEESKTISVYTENANGTESYIYGLSTLSDVGDLSNKYMQSFELKPEGGTEIRLKKLTLGNPHKDYYNPYWSVSTENVAPHISLNGCTYLQEFNFQNCSTYKGELDFSSSLGIEKILLTGSSVNGLTLPANGLLTELRLPTSLQVLNINGHKQLADAGFSLGTYHYGSTNKIGENDGGYYVNDFSNLTRLNIVDTPIDTYKILSGAYSLTHYNLQNINWRIIEEDIQYCYRNPQEFANNLNAEYYIYNNSNKSYDRYYETTYPEGNQLYEKVNMLNGENVVCLPVLERLQRLSTIDSAEHRASLSGTITLAIPGVIVDELAIYHKYNGIYPNITIKYDTDVMQVTKALQIRFYRNAYGDVDNIDALEPYFVARTGATAADTLANLTSIGFSDPVKTSTIEHTYTYTGRWYEWTTKKFYAIDAEHQEIGDVLFGNYSPTTSMDLLPIFNEKIRQYQIQLFNDDEILMAKVNMDYGVDIGLTFETSYPEYTCAYYNYKEHTNDGQLDKRWAFKGWQSRADKNLNASAPTWFTLTGKKVTENIDFYAFYKEESVYDTVSMINSIEDYFDYESCTVNGVSGLRIKLRDKYKHLLAGKITLPVTGPNNQPIISIGSFTDSNNTTPYQFEEIYFVEGMGESQYLEVANGAFMHNIDNVTVTSVTSLKAIYLPNSITRIRDNAFRNNRKLETITLNDNITNIDLSAFWYCENIINFGISELPKQLISLGGSAFYHVGPGASFTKLPTGINRLEPYCLAQCSGLSISQFGIETNPLTYIAETAIENSGNYQITSMTLYLTNGNTVELDESTGTSTFTTYKQNISNLTIYSNESISDEVISSWKIPTTVDCTITVIIQGEIVYTNKKEEESIND